jgi:hypothetical protein
LKLFASQTSSELASGLLVATALFHSLYDSVPGTQAADNHLCNIKNLLILFRNNMYMNLLAIIKHIY